MAAASVALEWAGGLPGRLRLLDQTRLPSAEVWLEIGEVGPLVEAIRRLAVRGAPALGCAGAYGVVLGVQACGADAAAWQEALAASARALAAARPTAVNLARGVERVAGLGRRLAAGGGDPAGWSAALLAEAAAVHREDQDLCRAIGRHGAALLPDPCTLLTHCNAGALATGGRGTALAVVYAVHAAGRRVEVYADETRPLLQGARLTAWELARAGVPVTLICDGAAGAALAAGRIQAVLVGSDRIAANGDVANKIGTYPLAVLAREHGVPFYVAAPTTTVDLQCPSGAAIPIELRDGREVLEAAGNSLAPPGVPAWNPAFDVTPARFVTALVTERGVLEKPDAAGLRAHLARPSGQAGAGASAG